MKLRISLAQINVQAGKFERNFERGLQMIDAAGKTGSHMVLLPELWTSGYDLQNSKIYGKQNVDVVKQLLNAAKEKNIAIGGSYLEEKFDGIYNTFLLINSEGTIQVKYRKVHLFGLMDEDKWLKPGGSLQTTCFLSGDIGLAICYDLRFPEMFRSYALRGVGLVTLCAQWPLKRVNHWQTLLRARAIEDQLFLAAVNCVGADGQLSFGGRSAIISPRGETIIEASDNEEELLTGEVDFSQVDEVRKSMPVLTDRRPEVY